MQYFKDLQDDDDEITIFSSDKERDDYLKGRYGSDYQVEAGEPKKEMDWRDPEAILTYASENKIVRDHYSKGETGPEKYEKYLKAHPKIIEHVRNMPLSSRTQQGSYDYTMSQGKGDYSEVPRELLDNKDFAMKLVSADPSAYVNLNSRFQADPSFALEALKSDGKCHPILNKDFLEQKDFVQEAAKVSPEIFHYLSDELRADRWIFKDALSHKDFRPMDVKEVERLKIDLSTKDFVYPSSDIDPTFFCDKELMTELCKKEKTMASKASFTLKNDPEFILETKAYDCMSDRLKKEVGGQDPEQAIKSMVSKNKLEKELAPKDSYEEMMRKLGAEHKAKQEQSITRAGKQKI
ncbi:DUF4116 domain-containing protein [Burkholderia cenocepacia]|uniref:DUF4116 domain-containing protein n=1 Tax=Burkholderia cenocepacia TaxID=95486 RepID=UPI000980FCC9|nr:DUF4116 domain-containing protein [Burkholderia cenocepacia]